MMELKQNTFQKFEKPENHHKTQNPDSKPKLTGKHTYTWENGDKYIGEWKEGVQSGLGTFTTHDGHQYSGQWAHGRANGYGVYKSNQGVVYEGYWRDFLKHGYGTEINSETGDKYIGNFYLGKFHGKGKL